MELTTNGDVVSWGGNHYGELGDYTSLGSSNAVHVVGLTNIIKIASGLNHSLAIDSYGALWAWGDNQFAQLGDGDLNKTNRPVQVSGMTNSVIAIAGNQETSIAAKADGTVWTWGAKYEGSGWNYTVVPTQVEGLTNVIAVAAGAQHFLVLSNAGTVWAWGSDNVDQLGDGMAGDSDTPVQVSGLSNIVAICAGDNHNLALDTNGCVWAWGLNDSGQVGDGETTNAAIPSPVMVFSNAVQIAAGANHSLAIDSNGALWAWGANNAGQLGTNGFSQTNLPVQVVELTNIITIAAGSDASVALDGDGNLWQWGASDSDGTNWVWGDEAGLPALAPQYDDFYNGQLPNLTITNGNNQITYGSLEFDQPLVFQVTDNGVALSNAPVSVEVIAGDMELRAVTNGVNYTGLRLTTDTNGMVSLIGHADHDVVETNCVIRVLAASRENITNLDFTETLIPVVYPTITITSPEDGSIYLVRTNQTLTLTITVDAEAAPGASIQEIDYSYQTNGGATTLFGISTQSLDYSFIWTNNLWWTNAFVCQYTISAMAVDNIGLRSYPRSVSITVALDSDGSGLPDYWQLQYFGQLGIATNYDADGDGISNLQEYKNGSSPTDYYNGNAPILRIVSGDYQSGVAGSFLPLPLKVLVTDTNATPLTNAPVTLTVTLGSVQLATNDAAPATNLAMRTDSDGVASVRVYFPPGAYLPDNIISVQAWSGENFSEVDSHQIMPGQLGHWRFDTTDWLGEEGQVPLAFTNLVSVPGWSNNAVQVDSNDPAYLVYRTVETNGERNIIVQNGSIRFWFKSDWNSSTTNSGTGPGNEGRLIELGSQDTADGWWSLVISADGTSLNFITQTNGVTLTNLTASINWVSNQWHQIVLTYGPDDSALYIDGWASVTNGAGVVYYPDAAALANGFYVGSDNSGNNQAKGQFDELVTFNYQLSPVEVVNDLGLPAPTVSLNVTNGVCGVALEEDQANAIISPVTGLIYPKLISFTVADNYADSVFAAKFGAFDSLSEGINITKLPPPVITPSGGYFNSPSNIVISLGPENLTNLVAGLYSTELARTAGSDEMQTVVTYAQGLRNQGYSDEDVRSNLINGVYFRGSAEYAGEYGVPGDVYTANTNYTIQYSLDNSLTWNDYNAPIQITNSVTLQARVKKSGTSDNRTHYACLASDAAEAQFDYIPASWLEEYFGDGYQSNTNAAPNADPDHDGLNNLQEYQLGTNPTNADTDGDGISDGAEVAAGSDPLNAASVPNRRLGYWRFNTTDWLGEEGQMPLGFTNLMGVPDWSINALAVDTNNPAYLAYRTVETNGEVNFIVQNGSIRFWFKSDWNSSTTNSGTGPGNEGRLIELGSQDTADGWWTLVFNADGTQLNFVTQTNGVGVTNLSTTISWTSNDWHQVVLTYGPANSTFYLDGQAVITNGLGISYYPDATALTNGFYVGSDNSGNNQAKGQFDELETFNYQLDAMSILNGYDAVNQDVNGPVDYSSELKVFITRPRNGSTLP
jgi:hypothetical protein